MDEGLSRKIEPFILHERFGARLHAEHGSDIPHGKYLPVNCAHRTSPGIPIALSELWDVSGHLALLMRATFFKYLFYLSAKLFKLRYNQCLGEDLCNESQITAYETFKV